MKSGKAGKLRVSKDGMGSNAMMGSTCLGWEDEIGTDQKESA